MKFWRFENLITKKEYPTNRNLETNQVEHLTRNPSPRRFLYKRHFELNDQFASQTTLCSLLQAIHHSPLQLTTSALISFSMSHLGAHKEIT